MKPDHQPPLFDHTGHPTPTSLSDLDHWAATELLSKGVAVPGGPGACANCHHALVWHNPGGHHYRPCERCSCKGFAKETTR